jgi:hypothetical protein
MLQAPFLLPPFFFFHTNCAKPFLSEEEVMPTLQERQGVYDRPFNVVTAFVWDRYVVIPSHPYHGLP